MTSFLVWDNLWLLRLIIRFITYVTAARGVCSLLHQEQPPTGVAPGRTLPKTDQPAYTHSCKATDRAGFTFRRGQFAFWQAWEDATDLNGGYINLYDETVIICVVWEILLRIQQSNEGKWVQQGKYNGLKVSVKNSQGRSLEKLEDAKGNNIKINLTELE